METYYPVKIHQPLREGGWRRYHILKVGEDRIESVTRSRGSPIGIGTRFAEEASRKIKLNFDYNPPISELDGQRVRKFNLFDRFWFEKAIKLWWNNERVLKDIKERDSRLVLA